MGTPAEVPVPRKRRSISFMTSEVPRYRRSGFAGRLAQPDLPASDDLVLLHQLTQAAEGFAAVGDLVLFGRLEFGSGFSQSIDQEKRIIAEAVFAAFFAEN